MSYNEIIQSAITTNLRYMSCQQYILQSQKMWFLIRINDFKSITTSQRVTCREKNWETSKNVFFLLDISDQVDTRFLSGFVYTIFMIF